jgi:hypothetical protein
MERVMPFAVAVWLPASLTVTPTEKLPLAVGVPETTPLAARVSPAGRAPEVRVQVYGVAPPEAWKAREYAVPWVPEGRAAEVIDRVAGAMTIEKLADLVCAGLPESAAVTVKEEVPAVVGVPKMIPLALFSVSPAGRLPVVTDQV